MKNKFLHILVLMMLSATTNAAYYKWVDEAGVVHYSNYIPAAESQLGHIELNKAGLKKKEVISAKRNKEILEKAERDKEANEAARKKEEEARLVREEEKRLASIFSNETEIINSYNSKLRMSQLTIDLLKSRHEKQAERLSNLERREEKSKNPKHKKMLSSQIDETMDNLKIYQQAITENVLERESVKKDFKKTLSRYRKMIAKKLVSND